MKCWGADLRVPVWRGLKNPVIVSIRMRTVETPLLCTVQEKLLRLFSVLQLTVAALLCMFTVCEVCKLALCVLLRFSQLLLQYFAGVGMLVWWAQRHLQTWHMYYKDWSQIQFKC